MQVQQMDHFNTKRYKIQKYKRLNCRMYPVLLYNKGDHWRRERPSGKDMNSGSSCMQGLRTLA